MDVDQAESWNERTVQHLVRYEALFQLLDDIRQTEDVAEISQRVATHWKYFAQVTAWRLVLPEAGGFRLIDGARGEAQLTDVSALGAWDAHHWRTQIPRLVRADDMGGYPEPPAHLTGRAMVEIQVLPFMHMGECTGLLSVAARRNPFGELDLKFIRLFGSHFTDLLSNLSLRRQAMEALHRKATCDALTGLLNRGAIIGHLEVQLERSRACAQPLSVILADIDFFKVINDSHGHLAGDLVLREVARRLLAHTFQGDRVGRYGGEEFLFVLQDCDASAVVNAAERLRHVVADSPVQVGTDPVSELQVTLSLGTASVDGRQEARLEELLKRADDALYRSKGSGRNRVTAG